MNRNLCAARTLTAVLFFSGIGQLAANTPPLDTAVETTRLNGRSTLLRDSNRLASEVTIKIRNTGATPLLPPVHAVVTFTAQGDGLEELTASGLLGGIGVAPHGTFYTDLSAQIGAGLAAGAETSFTFAFERPPALTVNYAVAIHGSRNGDPAVVIGGPYSGQAGEPVLFDASATSDPDGDALQFAWDFGEGGTAEGAAVSHVFAQPGLYTVMLTVTDARGAMVFRQAEVPVYPAGDFALARARTLDGDGHPLGGVAVFETGPDGQRQIESDEETGFVSLGTTAGAHRWRFEAPGYLTVQRAAELTQGRVAVVPYPWLARLKEPATLAPLQDTELVSPSKRVRVTLPAGALGPAGQASLTELHGQSLPLPLPPGWSPLAAFHLQLSAEALVDLPGQIALAEVVAAGRQMVLAYLDETSHPSKWKCEDEALSTGSSIKQVTLRQPGSYALVVADALPEGNPVAAIAGEPLEAGADPQLAIGVTASGMVNPASAIASRDPDLVTGQATVTFANAGQPLASGAWFAAEVEETYDLLDGRALKTPDYDTGFFAYQHPGDSVLATATARFPLRPRVLFGPEELSESKVTVQVRGPDAAAGGVITNGGGMLTAPGIRLTVPPGAVEGFTAAHLRALSAASLARFTGGLTPLLAFDLSLPPLATGMGLEIDLTSAQSPNAFFVLARCVTRGGESGLQPVLRLQSDAQGRLSSAEPNSGPRLSGIGGSGQFVLVPIAGPQAVVTGVVKKTDASPQGGVLTRVSGQPWLAVTNGAGAFKLLSPPGTVSIHALHPPTLHSGQAEAELADGAAVAAVEVVIGARGPRVVAISPTDGATKVRLVEPVILTFSIPVLPGTLVADGALELRKNSENSPVSGSLILARGNREARFLPANLLEPGTAYTLTLAETIEGVLGLPIEGQREFSFTTQPPENRGLGAQLVIYEPDAENVPQEVLNQLVGYNPDAGLSMVVAHGTPGTADPQAPVLLVNESTGMTSTVLSKSDGSFANFLRADEEDFVSAVFVNANGTRVTVPASRQLFDDGRVGLYNGGGILEAESDGGPVQVMIAPRTVKERAVFKLGVLSLTEIQILLGNSAPENALPVAGLNLSVETGTVEGESDMSFPLDPASLQMEPGFEPEDATFALTVAKDFEGGKIFQIVDKMRYEDGRITTNTFPFAGLFGFLLDSAAGDLAGGVANFTVISHFIGADRVIVTGKALSQRVDESGKPAGFPSPLQGAFITAEQGLSGMPGRIRAGDLYTATDREGKYALILPIEAGTASLPVFKPAGYVVAASHPSFATRPTRTVRFDEFGVDIGQELVFKRDFIFESGLLGWFDTGGPQITVSHKPGNAQVDEEIEVEALAFHGFARPTLKVELESVTGEKVPDEEGNLVDLQKSDVEFTDQGTSNSGGRGIKLKAKLKSPEHKLTATLRFTAEVDLRGTKLQRIVRYPVEIGAVPANVNNPLPVADRNDTVGPMVVASFPMHDDVLATGKTLVIQFNEPIDRAVETKAGLFTLSEDAGGTGAARVTHLRLSPDQQVLDVGFGFLKPGALYTLMIPPAAVMDLSGNLLDQKPSEPGDQSHSISFRAAPVQSRAVRGVEYGGGTVIHRNAMYVLERAGTGSLKIFDVSDPSVPGLVKELPLPGTPRDLALITNWNYVLKRDGPFVEDRVLLAVAGGSISGINDGDNNFIQPPKYIRIFDVTNPREPQILASPVVSYRISTISKLRWNAPYLGYFENGADIQQVGIIDLQSLIIGFRATREEILDFPLEGIGGIDLDGDGDYDDPGDILPVPRRIPAEFFGKEFGFTVQDAQYQILDFDFRGFQYLGITHGAGRVLGIGGIPVGQVNPGYRTVMFGGEIPRISGTLEFGKDARPRRLSSLIFADVEVEGDVKSLALALVTLNPDHDGKNKIKVIDFTLPASPAVLSELVFPSDYPMSAINSVSMRPDGLLAASTDRDVILLNPRLLALTQEDMNKGLHPAVAGFLPGAGNGHITLDQDENGLTPFSLAGSSGLIQSAPPVRFVSFPDSVTVIKPADLAMKPPQELDEILKQMLVTEDLMPARFKAESEAMVVGTLNPPDPVRHYHVLVIAPGGAGPTIDLGIESLNRVGWPLTNPGKDYAPVRAVTEQTAEKIGQKARADLDAPIRPFKAHRLSSEIFDPHYNLYLSEPFALVTERLPKEKLEELKGQISERHILYSSHLVRAFLDPENRSRAPLSPFAGEIDNQTKRIIPTAVAIARAMPTPYLMGNNPAPANGGLSLPGTFGSIQAHNGEFRNETVDFSLPSRRMPIIFQRAAGGQDQYEGPFGRGWDFYHNQRLVEVPTDKAPRPSGIRFPLIVRQPATSTVATDRDLIFESGEGRSILFKYKGASAPPEIQNDPLVQEFGWIADADGFYLPDVSETGVFEILLRFKDGQFVRLTPGGMQFWHDKTGRFTKVYDRYPLNHHVLEYNTRGQLTAIVDKSVKEDRFLKVGWYRLATDPDFDQDFDEKTSNALIAGKIARLKDFTDRDVLFEYNDDGTLKLRKGIEVAGANGGFSGRAETSYVWDDNANSLRGVIAGNGSNNGGTSLFTASTSYNDDRQPVAQSGNGAGGNVTVSIPLNNKAGQVDAVTATSTSADGATSTCKFDKNAYPKELTLSGGQTPNAVIKPEMDPDLGLPVKVTYPQGDFVTYVYDKDNPSWRSRGNLLTRTRNPGTRGGGSIAEEYLYDPKYNQLSGATTNADGKTVTYTLTGDKRDVASVAYEGGASTSHTYNESGQDLKTTMHFGVTTEVAYDSQTGYPVERKMGGVSTTIGYDNTEAGKLGMPITLTPGRGDAIRITYDKALQATRIQRGNHEEKRAYDENGNLKRLEKVVDSGVVQIEEHEYDQVNFLKKSTLKSVETGTGSEDLVTTFTPDSMFRPAQIVLPRGETKTISYDGHGNVIRIQIGSHAEDFEYDADGNQIVVKSGGQVVVTREFDGHNRLKKEIRHTGSAGNNEAEYTYFGSGKVKTTMLSGPFGVVLDHEVLQIDGLGRDVQEISRGDLVSLQTSYQYSANNGAVITQTGPRDTVVTSINQSGKPVSVSRYGATSTFTTDDNGNVTKVQTVEDGITYTTEFSFDSLDHIQQTKDGLGVLSDMTGHLRYDGLPKRVKDPLNRETVMTYSKLGEVLSKVSPSGIEFRHRYDKQRDQSFVGDKTNLGCAFEHTDGTMRLTKTTHRDGSTTNFDEPDNLNIPGRISLPGATITQMHDRQGRLLEQEVTSPGAPSYRLANLQYDAADRLREGDYGETGQNHVSHFYDKLGPLRRSTFTEGGHAFQINQDFHPDSSRKSVTYPSGRVLSEERDPSGRLTALSSLGEIWQASEWRGQGVPSKITLGGGVIEVDNRYDLRKRLTARRYRDEHGKTLADFRFKWDAAGNLNARQMVSPGGPADLFEYDADDRLVRQEAGARLVVPGENAPLLAGLSGGEGFRAGAWARSYHYDAGGLDLLETCVSHNPRGLMPPSFFASASGRDGFLHAQTLDGDNRGPSDARGNVTRTHVLVRPDGQTDPQPAMVDLAYNGFNHLVRASRGDGVTVDYHYQMNGIMHRRVVRQSGTVLEDRNYIWDKGRLIEEYDLMNGTPDLVHRFYYADGDVPVAADLKQTGQWRRVYYLHDQVWSVTGVVDEAGQVLERVRYDAFGQPIIELADSAPPLVKTIDFEAASGDWIIVFSEPVTPPPANTAFSENLVTNAQSIAGMISLNGAGGAVTYEPAMPGRPAFSAIRFSPTSAPAGTVTVQVEGQKIIDSWGNGNSQEVFTVQAPDGSSDDRIYDASVSTAPVRSAWSGVESPFLFQGQFHDRFTGLIYMRARFYDPYTGQFMQCDPAPYSDSVNPYAGLAHNPVSKRDPEGLSTKTSALHIKEFMSARGLTDIEIEAFTNVLKRRMISGQQIRMSIRGGGPGAKANLRRMHATNGVQNKPSVIGEKTGDTAKLDFTDQLGRKREVVSDLDILHLEINGKMASHKDAMKLFGDINREYKKLFRAKHGLGIPINPPIQHGYHTGMPLIASMRHKQAFSAGKYKFFDRPGGKVGLWQQKNKYIDTDFINQVKHPGDSFSFHSTPDVIKVYDTPKWQTHKDILESEKVLKWQQMKNFMWPTGYGANWHQWAGDYHAHLAIEGLMPTPIQNGVRLWSGGVVARGIDSDGIDPE